MIPARFDPATAAEQLREVLSPAHTVAAVCHENPDADTIGGAVAMALVARQLGKQAEVISADPLGPAFDFLPEAARIQTAPTRIADLIVVCDAATLPRIGRIAQEHASWLAGGTIVNIDHHVTNTCFGAVNIVDPTAAATCQVLAALLPHLGVDPDPETATALLTGIVRDSHGFSDRSTSPTTLQLAAGLMAAGADLPLVQRRILHELPYATMRLWGRLLDGVGTAVDGRVVYAVLYPSMLEETGTRDLDADGFAEFLARTRGAEITILMRELAPDETRVSLRVSDAVDATLIAGRFGGGGHTQRAGCTIRASAPQAVEELLLACRDALTETGSRATR